VTITNGLSVNTKVPIFSVATNSTAFSVEKYVTGQPGSTLSQNLEPNSSYRWIQAGTEVQAPRIAFDSTDDYTQYYLYSSDPNVAQSVDSVVYTSEDVNLVVTNEPNYQTSSRSVTAWGPWISYEKADSPDNYPGGKNGLTPMQAPALNRNDGTAYMFPYTSQDDYIQQTNESVLQQTGRYYPGSFMTAKLANGATTDVAYRLPLSFSDFTQNVWDPSGAVATQKPKPSRVISRWYSRQSLNGTNRTAP
jgi:hypothetical protein